MKIRLFDFFGMQSFAEALAKLKPVILQRAYWHFDFSRHPLVGTVVHLQALTQHQFFAGW